MGSVAAGRIGSDLISSKWALRQHSLKNLAANDQHANPKSILVIIIIIIIITPYYYYYSLRWCNPALRGRVMRSAVRADDNVHRRGAVPETKHECIVCAVAACGPAPGPQLRDPDLKL